MAEISSYFEDLDYQQRWQFDGRQNPSHNEIKKMDH